MITRTNPETNILFIGFRSFIILFDSLETDRAIDVNVQTVKFIFILTFSLKGMFNVWKKLSEQKYPKFILKILSECAFDKNSLHLLTENSIVDIEHYVRKHPKLLEKTVYETENIAEFTFKIGHKHLILGIPKYLKNIEAAIKKNKEEKKNSPSFEIDIKNQEITAIVSRLIQRVRNYGNVFKLNLNVSLDNIKKFEKNETGYKCNLICSTCGKLCSCFYKNTHWIISNFVAHVRSHNTQTPAQTPAQTSTQISSRNTRENSSTVYVVNSNIQELQTILIG